MVRKIRNNHQSNNVVSARDIMEKYAVSYQTVNHYTDFGLLPVLAKKGNVRLYDKNVVQKRMRKMKKLTEEGYSLRLIRKKIIGI